VLALCKRRDAVASARSSHLLGPAIVLLRLRGCVMKRHEDSVFALHLICQEANVIR